MNGTRKRVLLVVLGVVVVLAVLVTIYHVSQRETYLSDDPLFGSFTIFQTAAGSTVLVRTKFSGPRKRETS